MKEKNKTYSFIFLNILALAVYFFCFLNFKIGINEKVMFSSPDAQSYWGVANWINFNIKTSALEIRPILYPLFIALFYKIGGIYAIWIVQILFWLATINLVFWSLLKLTKGLAWSFIGGFLIIFNFSLISLTRHALTEVATTFLLSVLVTFCVKNKYRFKQLYFIHGCIFLMAVLTIIKPVFSIPLYILLIFPLFFISQYLKRVKNFLFLFLSLLPVIIQVTMMKSQFGNFEVSRVGSLAVNEYIFPQGIQYVDKIGRKEALSITKTYSNAEKFKFLENHLDTFSYRFFNNLEDNIKADAPFLNEENGFGNRAFYDYMLFINKCYYYLHFIFLPIIVFLIFFLLKNKEYSSLVLFGGLYCLGFYFVIVTGISFWQGDRLVLPSISLWSFIYIYSAYILLKILRKNKEFFLRDFQHKIKI